MNPLVASKVTRVMMMVMIWVMMLKMTQVTVTMNDGGSKLSFDLLTCSWHPRPSPATLLSVFFNLSTCTLPLIVRRRRMVVDDDEYEDEKEEEVNRNWDFCL